MGSMKDLLGDTPYPEAYARHTDLPTSHAAADRVRPIVNALEAKVGEYIVACGARGATWDEIAAGTGLDKASVSPRFKPLRGKGVIRAASVDGRVVKRDGQTVWVATDGR